MRGKGQGQGDGCDHQGITPAYAGKSRFPSSTAPYRRDHPRVCGEKGWDYDAFLYQLGSPPRVRGKDTGGGLNLPVAGITPACAGKSSVPVCWASLAEDHPRVCGEKFATPCAPMLVKGSPPRMRGKARSADSGNLGVGITPAHAGKRDKTAIFEEWCRDHPRVCGEKGEKGGRSHEQQGSPPHVRGKAGLSHGCLVLVGITPAYAGKRVAVRSDLGTIRDHPRVCGEKGVVDLCHVEVNGITPAYAGKRLRCRTNCC